MRISRAVGGKIQSAVTELGWRAALCYGLDRLLAAHWGIGAVHRYVFVAQPLRPTPVPEAFRLQRLNPQADRPVFEALTSPDALAYRLSQHCDCYVLWRGDQALGCLWIAYGQFDEDEVRACYTLQDPSSIWDFGVWIDPNHRMSRAFQALWALTSAALCEAGYQTSLSRISAFNPSSLAAHQRLGGRVIGGATFLRLGHWQVAWGPSTRLHLSRSNQARVHFSFGNHHVR